MRRWLVACFQYWLNWCFADFVMFLRSIAMFVHFPGSYPIEIADCCPDFQCSTLRLRAALRSRISLLAVSTMLCSYLCASFACSAGHPAAGVTMNSFSCYSCLYSGWFSTCSSCAIYDQIKFSLRVADLASTMLCLSAISEMLTDDTFLPSS